MRQAPFSRLVPGGSIRAAEHNRLLDQVEALARLAGPGLTYGSTGQAFRPPDPWFLKGRVVSGPDELGRYAVLQVDRTREGPAFAPRDTPGGMVWQPDYVPAYEGNGVIVAPGTLVELRRGVGDFWWFLHCCPGGESGSGESGSESGSGSGSDSPGSTSLPASLCDGNLVVDPPGKLYLSWTVESTDGSPCADCTPGVIELGPYLGGAHPNCPGTVSHWNGFTAWDYHCPQLPGWISQRTLCAGVGCHAPCVTTLGPNKLRVQLFWDAFRLDFGATCLGIDSLDICVSSERPVLATFDYVALPFGCANICTGAAGTVWHFTLTE